MPRAVAGTMMPTDEERGQLGSRLLCKNRPTFGHEEPAELVGADEEEGQLHHRASEE